MGDIGPVGDSTYRSGLQTAVTQPDTAAKDGPPKTPLIEKRGKSRTPDGSDSDGGGSSNGNGRVAGNNGGSSDLDDLPDGSNVNTRF